MIQGLLSSCLHAGLGRRHSGSLEVDWIDRGLPKAKYGKQTKNKQQTTIIIIIMTWDIPPCTNSPE